MHTKPNSKEIAYRDARIRQAIVESLPPRGDDGRDYPVRRAELAGGVMDLTFDIRRDGMLPAGFSRNLQYLVGMGIVGVSLRSVLKFEPPENELAQRKYWLKIDKKKRKEILTSMDDEVDRASRSRPCPIYQDEDHASIPV